MKRLFFLFFLAAASALAPVRAEIPPVRNLAALGQEAERQGKALVVFFYQEQCHYCETVRKQYLKPMSRDEAYTDRIIIRMIDIRSETAIKDFSGQSLAQRRFAKRERKTFTPTIAFYGPRGQSLVRPLVGLKGGRDFYGYHLEKGIEKAEAALQELL